MDYSNLHVNEIQEGLDGAIIITWSCPGIGFGQYTLIPTESGWNGESEHMDKGDDKSFLEALLQCIMKNTTIIA